MDDVVIAWIVVIVAGLLEPTWVYFMQRSEGFKIHKWTICMAIFLFLSIFLMSIAMKTIGPGTTYAVWTGIGVIGAAVIGALFFKERVTWIRASCILLVLIGIVGINLVGGAA